MAEYQEVMRQWTRMCNSVPGKSTLKNLCRDKESGYICPMHNSGLCNRSVALQTDKDRLAGEKTIMSWAAEHPEHVYPTWGEWLISVRAARKIPVDIPAEMPDGRIIEAPWETVVAFNEPIPAEIAEKYGIEPKE